MSDDEIKDLNEDAERLKKVLEETAALMKELRAAANQFGIDFDNATSSADDVAASMRSIIDAAIKKDSITKEEEIALRNIVTLLNSGLEIDGKKVALGGQYNNILNQALKLQEASLDRQLKNNIEEAKSLNLVRQYRDQKEKIAALTRTQALQAMTGMLINNRLLQIATDLLKTHSSISAEMNKITLEGDRYRDVIMNAAESVAGVSFKEAQDATVALVRGMSDFTRMSATAQTELAATTSQFEKLGISLENQTKMNQVASKAFGMSASQATNFYSELVTFSKSAKVPMDEINRNLASIGDRLSLFGRQNYQQVFKDLSAAAKDFGIEAGKMLDVTERFTTFEGAAQAAGRLNAILGGNFVSGLGLMTSALESPVDVFRQLKTAMDMSGKEFANMTQAQKRYIAEKIGLSLTETESLFGNSLREGTQNLKERLATQEELNELSAKSTQVFQRLQIVIMKIVNSPFISTVVNVIEGFVKLLEEGDKTFGALIGNALAFIVGLGWIGKGLLFLFSPLKSVATFIGLIIKALIGKTASTSAEVLALNAHTASLRANTVALRLNTMALNASKNASKGAGAGFLTIAGYTALFVAALIGLGFAINLVVVGLGKMADGFARWNDAQARNTEATTKQAQVFSNLATTIKDMSNLKSNLVSFAEGIQQIGSAINTINLSTLRELNALVGAPLSAEFTTRSNATVETRVVPVKVVEIEMNATREEQRQQMSLVNRGKETNKEVKISINSPISLDGADWGRLISNGIGIYEESQGREITPGLSSYGGADILNDR